MSDEVVLDRTRLLTCFQGNQAAADKILHQFVLSFPDDMRKLREFVTEGKFDEAHNSAHAFKGAALNVGAGKVAASALVLENAYDEQRNPPPSQPDAEVMLDSLEDALMELMEAVMEDE
mmetsp:Transcript_35912/g.81789  ORF Transcript_35912/g.81789 Transcript_35912/m.81789 type:complete len:119 (+) Transcript_35912:46-402(+)